jgi:hypothetical protein
MRLVLALTLAASIASAAAQPAPQVPAAPDPNCLPETRQNTPGSDSGATLSDKLAESRGVICPPAVDPAMTQKPPAEGSLKVVPPPGSPGGNPNIQPK